LRLLLRLWSTAKPASYNVRGLKRVLAAEVCGMTQDGRGVGQDKYNFLNMGYIMINATIFISYH